MKSRKAIVFYILVYLLVSFPLSSKAQVVTNQEAYRSSLIELIKVLQKQISLLQAELDRRHENKTPVVSDEGSLSKRVQILDTYVVNDISDVEKISNKTQREYFVRVFQLFTEEYEKKLKKLVVFRDGVTGYDSFVETFGQQNKDWVYAVNEEMLDADKNTNDELIIHEMGHLISYEEVSNMTKPANYYCHSYFEMYGCSEPNSLIFLFSKKFWSDGDLSRAKSYSNLNNYEDIVYNHYLKHKDEYVSDYADSSPEEDFSETFMFYTLDLPNKGKVAQGKINYLASYSKIRLIRNEILKSLGEI